jgi:hypothetical protein
VAQGGLSLGLLHTYRRTHSYTLLPSSQVWQTHMMHAAQNRAVVLPAWPPVQSTVARIIQAALHCSRRPHCSPDAQVAATCKQTMVHSWLAQLKCNSASVKDCVVLCKLHRTKLLGPQAMTRSRQIRLLMSLRVSMASWHHPQ